MECDPSDPAEFPSGFFGRDHKKAGFDGISETEYLERYGIRFDDKLIETLNKYRPEYIIEEKGRYHFTEKGFLVSNAILAEMI